MKSFNRITIVLVLLAVTLFATACSGDGGSLRVVALEACSLLGATTDDTNVSNTNSPTDAAKAFLEGTFKADAATLRSVTCEAQRGEITDEALAQMNEAMTAMGTVDLTGVTYTYNEAAKTVSLGGEIKATVQGVAVDIPVSSMFADGLPVIEEGGGWRVCPTGGLSG